MKILVINSGSSSLKYQFFDMLTENVIFSGSVERIGETRSDILHQGFDKQQQATQIRNSEVVADHEQAFIRVIHTIRSSEGHAEIDSIDAIGHRVVHGGEAFQQPTRVDADVMAAIRKVCPLAPLHNPANLTGIEVCLKLFPDVPQVAVFDTAFHQTMPQHAYRYPLPDDWYQEYGVRRYGFHGTSHAFVAQQAAVYLRRPLAGLNLISLHLGNGASAAAIAAGKCIDTSMGFTPLAGLMMGTRCGDVDPAIIFYMQNQGGLSPAELDSALNTASGLKGVCGVNDMREATRRAESGDTRARLAVEMYCYRIKKYIGAYTAALGQVDAIIFTAGIGENSAAIRARSVSHLDQLGIAIDERLNAASTQGIREIQAETSRVRLLVIPTDEELSIARQTAACIS